MAIIGVLSVTGVAGYKAAVRKALANNLLNQASMRATDVATQIASGNLDSLGNDAFDGNLGSGVTMSSAVKGPDGYTDYDESDEQFTLTLEGLDEELCQQMQSMAGGSRSVVRSVLCDGDKAILTFNKDLSAKSYKYEANYKTREECEEVGRIWCSGSAKCVENDCCENQVVGQCQKCTEDSGEVLTNQMEGELCDFEGIQDGFCYQGECTKIIDEKCLNGGSICPTSNGDVCCDATEFCVGDLLETPCIRHDPATGCTTNLDCESAEVCPDNNCFCDIGSGLSAAQSAGTCQARVDKYAPSNPISIVGLGSIVRSEVSMHAISAQNWCKSMGKRFIHPSDLGCYESGTSNLIKEGFCCAKGKVCDDWSENGMWQAKVQQAFVNFFPFLSTAFAADSVWKETPYELTEEGKKLAENYSPTIVQLREKLGVDPSNGNNAFFLMGGTMYLLEGRLVAGERANVSFVICR